MTVSPRGLDLTPELPAARFEVRRIASEARAALGRVFASLETDARRNFEDSSLAGAVEAFAAYPPHTDYNHLAPAGDATLGELRGRGGPELEGTFARLLVLATLASLPERTPDLIIPRCRWLDIEFDLQALLDAMSQGESSPFDADTFAKDLAVAQLRSIPVHGGISTPIRVTMRRLLHRSPWTAKLAAIRRFPRGYDRPKLVLSLHAGRDFASHFRDVGATHLVRQAGTLAANPELAGTVSIAWINDPALRSVSPNISLPANQNLRAGGFRFATTTSPESTSSALQASRTRRRLFDEGRYTPRTYGIFLPRRDLLRWVASRIRADANGPAA